MNEDESGRPQLQHKLQELGRRYLTRTAGEVHTMQQALAGSDGHDPQITIELGQIAHRIHGSGAMLGFFTVTEQARELDEFMKTRGDLALSEAERDYVRQQLQRLEQVIQNAVQKTS